MNGTTMRIPVLAANWKMHKTVKDARAFIRAFTPRVADVSELEIVLAPPFTAIAAVADACRDTRIAVAGQDLYWETQGAFTGEISAEMLSAAGASHVIIGHSERRHLFGDDDTTVNQKAQAAIGAGLTPIVCVGETLDQRKANQTLEVLALQIECGVRGLTADQVAMLIVAYEPVWAIGTGLTATPDQAQEIHAYIRNRLSEIAGGEAADRCRLLYGGSVKPENARELSAERDVDGALVGGASLNPDSFAEIVAACRPRTV